MKRLIYLGLGILLSACGYRVGGGTLLTPCDTLCVPYATGDTYGLFTESLVKELSKSRSGKIVNGNARYLVQVVLRCPREQVVGYRYDRKGERGEIERRVIPSEKRAAIGAEVTVVDRVGRCVVLGPVLVEADVTYDFDIYSNHSNVNILSLGQLNDGDVSRDVVISPLYRELAARVAQFLANSW